MRNIIIDCDPGHDDIMGILVALAHQEELNILGFTTVCGNQTVQKVTNNLLKVLDYLGFSYPVAKGAAKPLVKEAEPQPGAHGESGLDGPNLPANTSRPVKDDASEFLFRTLTASEEKVTLVCLGPLTNIALLLQKHPESAEKIEEIVLMGGSIYSGNILPKAEFNIYHDPEAAAEVFGSEVKVVMAGLEVCEAGSIWHTEAEILKYKGKVCQLVYDLYGFFSQYSRKRGREKTPIFDVVPVIYLLKPEMFKSVYCQILVETEGTYCRGMTVSDIREDRDKSKDRTLVLTDVNREHFIRYFLDSLNQLDKILLRRA